MSGMAFADLAALGERLEQTTKRLELASLVAGFLRSLRPEEIAPSVRLLIGRVFPEWDDRTMAMSWRAVSGIVRSLVRPTDEQQEQISAQAEDTGQAVQRLMEMARREAPQGPPLTVLEVYRTFEEIAEMKGAGARADKAALLRSLFLRASPVEAKVLAKTVIGEMRHGVSEGIMLEAIARVAGAKLALAQRANMLWGDLGEVAQAALTSGDEGLDRATLRLFRPVKPMLAHTADDLSEPFERYQGYVALEYKLDGARVQIHKRGGQVRIYSRQLSDVTDSLPEIVETVRRALRVEEAVVEGEVVGVDREGRPLPFQEVMRRFRRTHDVAAVAQEIPVEIHLFDLLHADGESLIDLPNAGRWARLSELAAGDLLVSRAQPTSIEEATAFAECARAAGHEGVMAKDLCSGYTPGMRGRAWLKLKHVMTLDCVVVAADWGYGRRHGWLSNYHLAVRDEGCWEFPVVGKTFKGLTDQEFVQMTERLLGLEVRRARGTVVVRPEMVVEVAFNEVQTSRRYPSGYALRFARIHRLRPDKPPQEADTLETVRQVYEAQFQYKGRGQSPSGTL